MARQHKLRMIAASAVLAVGVGVAAPALATPVFTVNPNSISGVTAGSTFNADFLSGHSSTRVVQQSGNTYSSDGWIQVDSFSLAGTGVSPNISRLRLDYGLYATFSQTFTCSGMLSPGVTCSVSSINLGLYADPGLNDTFTQATLGANPSVANTAGDTLLATATQVTAGTAGLNSLGGAFENVNTNFTLTSAGSAYFVNPVPFYNLAFSEFNNTTQGVTCSPASCSDVTVVAITNETGGTDFRAVTVPEPSVLAIIGVGLLGIGFVSRRRKV